jgi:hypothetical protein
MEHMSDVVRKPIAWRIHDMDVAWFAAQGKHCEGRRGTRRCKDAITIVRWRWYRSAEAGRVLVAERLLCDEHGQQFADRHRIEIEPPPAEPHHPGAREGQ